MILLPRFEDQVEAELIRVDEELHARFGRDETRWTPSQIRQYLLRLDAARIQTGWVTVR